MKRILLVSVFMFVAVSILSACAPAPVVTPTTKPVISHAVVNHVVGANCDINGSDMIQVGTAMKFGDGYVICGQNGAYSSQVLPSDIILNVDRDPLEKTPVAGNCPKIGSLQFHTVDGTSIEIFSYNQDAKSLCYNVPLLHDLLGDTIAVEIENTFMFFSGVRFYQVKVVGRNEWYYLDQLNPVFKPNEASVTTNLVWDKNLGRYTVVLP